jgi:putative endonuclease
MNYFVYILNCKDKTLYTGITNNLEKRLKAHNSLKSGAHYTKIRRPVKLIYSEKYNNKSKALKRELEIKNLTRLEKLKLINK